jgi:hypothetical protein
MRDLKLSDDATWADAAVFEILRKAAKGDLAAIKEIIDRVEGKATSFEEEKVDAKEAHVYLVVGDRKNLENAKPVTDSVEITRGINKP